MVKIIKKLRENIFSVQNSRDRKHKIFKIFFFKIKVKCDYFRMIKYKLIKHGENPHFFSKSTQYFLRKYSYIPNEIKKNYSAGIETQLLPHHVWSMWLQGEENAPDTVKLCLASIKKFYPNVTIITENNFSDYIDIPEVIYEKYKKGIIRHCHFSDLIRVCLLEKYGGIWLDATCFLTSPVPEYILKEPFYILKAEAGSPSNWFITSIPHYYITRVLKQFLTDYWTRENFTLTYFFFHEYIWLQAKENKFVKKYWNKILPTHNRYYFVVDRLLEGYDNKEALDYFCSVTFVNKLHYKKEKKYAKHCLFEYLKNKFYDNK